MHRILAICLVLVALPVAAQEDSGPGGEDEGMEFLDRGTRQLLKDFLERMDPALDELQRDLGLALEAFRQGIGDLQMYHPPEILPNGDIIIRRRQPHEIEPYDAPDPAPAPAPDEGEVIEL